MGARPRFRFTRRVNMDRGQGLSLGAIAPPPREGRSHSGPTEGPSGLGPQAPLGERSEPQSEGLDPLGEGTSPLMGEDRTSKRGLRPLPSRAFRLRAYRPLLEGRRPTLKEVSDP